MGENGRKLCELLSKGQSSRNQRKNPKQKPEKNTTRLDSYNGMILNKYMEPSPKLIQIKSIQFKKSDINLITLLISNYIMENHGYDVMDLVDEIR